MVDYQTDRSPFQALIDAGKERLDELKALGNKLFEHLSPADFLTILFPPALGLDVLYGTLSHEPLPDHGFDEKYPEPALLQASLEMAHWLSTNYFRTRIHGVKNLPKGTPMLLVGNHNGGMMPIDALFAIDAIRDRLGEDATVHPLVHDIAYIAPRVARTAERMGILRANRENALDALRAGRHVLVYPGGDEDAFRTFSERHQVVLAGRKGFVRVAMRAGVPIVPLVSVGLHESFFVISKGRGLAEKLGLRKLFRTELFPIALSLPWGISPAFIPFLPLPTSIEMQFEAPVYVEGKPDDEAAVAEVYDQIATTMQATMDDLSKERIPIVGR